MNSRQKLTLIRILISCALLAGIHFIPVNGVIKALLYLVPYLIIGYDILFKAFKGIRNLKALDECFLMAVATIGAFILGLYSGEGYEEAVAVMIFYQTGELFESYAVGKSRASISDLMEICPDHANIMGPEGSLIRKDPEDIETGTVIYIEPGERVPIDGIIEEGKTAFDLSPLTGESVPVSAGPGDEAVSGSINLKGLIAVRTTKDFSESTASKILELIEDAGSRKSRSEKFISKFARIYTPAVVLAALAVGIIPPLVSIIFGNGAEWSIWIYRALTFLVISCPCALVISIPLSFFAGLGGAGRSGILVKGSNYLETLSKVDTIALDKTGTLTKGVFDVTAIHPSDMDEDTLLHLAAHCERYSSHPIGESLKRAYENENDGCSVTDVEEISGKGVRASINGMDVLAGNEKLMDAYGIEYKECHLKGTTVHVAVNGKYAGHILISDIIKENAKSAIEDMRRKGAKKIVLLTGDNEYAANDVGSVLGIDKVYWGLMPDEKLHVMEELIKSSSSSDKKVAYAGDGINDAPVLTLSDVGIAMGAMGSDAAIEAADVVIMDDDPGKISKAMAVAKKCMRIVKENIVFAIGVKLICLILSAFGMTGMWMAIFADVGVMILAVLNSIRCMFVSSNI